MGAGFYRKWDGKLKDTLIYTFKVLNFIELLDTGSNVELNNELVLLSLCLVLQHCNHSATAIHTHALTGL